MSTANGLKQLYTATGQRAVGTATATEPTLAQLFAQLDEARETLIAVKAEHVEASRADSAARNREINAQREYDARLLAFENVSRIFASRDRK